jgi:hypothetical protein
VGWSKVRGLWCNKARNCSAFSPESGVDGVGTRGTFVEAAQAEAVESADGVANRLLVASQVVGNPWGAFPSDAGQQNLAAA